MKNIIIIDNNIEINFKLSEEISTEEIINIIFKNIKRISNLKENKKKLEEIKKKKICNTQELIEEDILSEEDKNNFLDYINNIVILSAEDLQVIKNANTKEDLKNNLSKRLIELYENYDLIM